MALLISGTGIALSITSWALLLIRREQMNESIREVKAMQGIEEFVWKWSKLEEISKHILVSKGNEFNQYSIREIIEQLYENNLIDREDIISLEEAIQIRNTVVHGENIIPKKVLEHFSSKVDAIISKIIGKTSSK